MSRNNGFVDLQVNGFFGVDLNSDRITGEELHSLCRQLQQQQVAGILATVITDEIDVMAARLERIARLREQDELVSSLIWGFHIEGPFINETPGYVGAHPRATVQPANSDAMMRLLESSQGLTRIVTLAPERDPGQQVTRSLVKQDIVVSAGHCDPSRDELAAAIDAGLGMFTHLGNGCPATLPRHDNVIQRALSFSGQLWYSFIADGVHVPFFALRNYIERVGVGHTILVSDAISATGLGPGTFELGGQQVVVDDRGVTRIAGDDSHLAGSTINMLQSASNAREHLSYGDDDVLAMVSTNPRALLTGQKPS